MTIALTCVAVIAIRFLEEVVKKIIQWFSERKSVKKTYSYKRISAIVTPEFHEKLKAHVVLLNMTITDFILMAISEKLKQCE